MKRLKWLFFMACLAGIIGFLHNATGLLIRYGIGSDYQGIMPEISADERHYFRQVQTAMQGYYQPLNRYIEEYWSQSRRGNWPDFQGYNLHGFIGTRLGFSFWTWIIVSRTLFPMVVFYMLYRLFRTLDFTRRWSLALALSQVLTPYILQGRVEFLFRHLCEFMLKRGWEYGWIFLSYKYDLPMLRPVNPSFTILFFLGALLMLAQWLKKPRKYYKMILMVVFFWLAFKMYFYFWSAFGALLFCVWVGSICRKQWRVALPLAPVFLLGLVYIFPRISPLLSRDMPEKILYLSMIPSRKILISPAVFVSALLLGLYFFLRKKNPLPEAQSPRSLLILAAPWAVIITMNQQILTGRIVQPWHYELFTSPIFLSIFFFCVFLNRRNMPSIIAHFAAFWETHWFRIYMGLGALVIFLILGTLQIFLLYFRYSPHTNHALWPVGCLLLSLALFAIGLVFGFLGAVQFAHGRIPWERFSRAVFYFVVALTLSESVSRIVLRSVMLESLARRENQIAPALSWLSKEPAGVVMAEPNTADLIPIYTPHSVYISKNVTFYPIPNRAEIRQRLYHFLTVFCVGPNNFLKYAAIPPYRFIIWGMVPTDEKRELFTFGEIGQVSNQNREIALSDFMAERRSLMENRGRLWKLDYIIVRAEDMRDFTNPPIKDFVEMPPAYYDAYAMIYRLKKAQTE